MRDHPVHIMNVQQEAAIPQTKASDKDASVPVGCNHLHPPLPFSPSQSKSCYHVTIPERVNVKSKLKNCNKAAQPMPDIAVVCTIITRTTHTGIRSWMSRMAVRHITTKQL